MKNFFTADTHFNHKNIAGPKISKWSTGYRHFNSVAEMNETMITNWNNKVGVDDVVWHLGDFSFGDPNQFLHRLNGRVNLIVGNHDDWFLVDRTPFHSAANYREITIDGQLIVLCHYPMVTWNKCSRGSFMLYGHEHGHLPDPKNKSMDVGVDCHNFTPLSFEEIAKIMDKKQITNLHHATNKTKT